jgi:hypothetical protein
MSDTTKGFLIVSAILVGGFVFIDLRARQIDRTIKALPSNLVSGVLGRG